LTSPTELDALRDTFARTDGMIGLEESIELYRLARDARSGCIVEIGSYRGRSTVFLALGSRAGTGATVFAVDPHRERIGALGGRFGPQDRIPFLEAMLSHGCGELVAPVQLDSEQAAAAWREPISLLFLDGDHSVAAVERDLEAWLPHLAPLGTVAFDDATEPELGPATALRRLHANGSIRGHRTVGRLAIIGPGDWSRFPGPARR